MLFGAPRHVVLIIRSPIMPDAIWCIPTCAINYSVQSPIMTDAVWYIPTRGITYLVSHHDGCYLVHPDTWYHLFGFPSWLMMFGASQHVVSLIRPPIMTDAVWYIPSRGITYSVSHHDGCRLVHPDTWYHLFGLPS